MKLYYFPGSCALAPHIVLEWLGADFDAVRIEKGDPEYLKINPQGEPSDDYLIDPEGSISIILRRGAKKARVLFGLNVQSNGLPRPPKFLAL